MPYELSWYSPNEVLHLDLENSLTSSELGEINHEITAILDQTEEQISLFINASHLKAGYYTVDSLRATQNYMNHFKLHTIVVFSQHKLNRLITLLAFSLGKARFVQFDDLEASKRFITQTMENKRKKVS